MAYRFANRMSVLIIVTVSTSATTITLETGGGNKIPTLAVGDVVQAAMIATTGVVEIVQVTQVDGDVLTVLRGQENTPVSTFPAGSRFEVRLTTRVLDNFLQRTGGTMQGDLNMNNKQLLNVKYPPALTFQNIHAQYIRHRDVPESAPGAPDERFIFFPGQNKQPQIGQFPIISKDMVAGIIFDWWGDVNSVPAHLKLCDGSNGTPDLRGKFIRAWRPGIEGVDGQGGSESTTTSSVAAHAHSGVTQQALLNASNVPGHVITTTGFPVAPGSGQDRLTNVSVTHDNSQLGHLHGIVPDGAHAHSVTTLPPYYVLAKVMFR